MDEKNKELADRYDVVIVGSGPAGASTAKALSGSGLNIVIVERRNLPRYKMCSGMLFPSSVKYTEDNFGEIPEEVYSDPMTLYGNRVCGEIGGDILEAPFSIFDAGPELSEHGRSVKRAEYDHWLCKQSDAQIVDNCRFMGMSGDAGDYTVELKHAGADKKVKTKFIVGADGPLSSVRKKINPKFDDNLCFIPNYEEWYKGSIDLDPGWLYIFMDRKFGSYMATVFHKDGHIILVTGVQKEQSTKSHFNAFVDYVKQEHGLVIEEKTASHGIVLTDMCATENFYLGDKNIILVGEAAGFLRYGEGITSALVTGAAAGESILESIKTGKPVLDYYREASTPEKDACNAASKIIQAATGINMFTRK